MGEGGGGYVAAASRPFLDKPTSRAPYFGVDFTLLRAWLSHALYDLPAPSRSHPAFIHGFGLHTQPRNISPGMHGPSLIFIPMLFLPYVGERREVQHALFAMQTEDARWEHASPKGGNIHMPIFDFPP